MGLVVVVAMTNILFGKRKQPHGCEATSQLSPAVCKQSNDQQPVLIASVVVCAHLPREFCNSRIPGCSPVAGTPFLGCRLSAIVFHDLVIIFLIPPPPPPLPTLPRSRGPATHSSLRGSPPAVQPRRRGENASSCKIGEFSLCLLFLPSLLSPPPPPPPPLLFTIHLLSSSFSLISLVTQILKQQLYYPYSALLSSFSFDFSKLQIRSVPTSVLRGKIDKTYSTSKNISRNVH